MRNNLEHCHYSMIHSAILSCPTALPCGRGDVEIAELDIARPDNAAPDRKGGQRETVITQ